MSFAAKRPFSSSSIVSGSKSFNLVVNFGHPFAPEDPFSETFSFCFFSDSFMSSHTSDKSSYYSKISLQNHDYFNEFLFSQFTCITCCKFFRVIFFFIFDSGFNFISFHFFASFPEWSSTSDKFKNYTAFFNVSL